MAEYTKKMAKLFDGLRLDNCHSTPIHVARYLLDIARHVKPNIYITAELFVPNNSQEIVFKFIF